MEKALIAQKKEQMEENSMCPQSVWVIQCAAEGERVYASELDAKEAWVQSETNITNFEGNDAARKLYNDGLMDLISKEKVPTHFGRAIAKFDQINEMMNGEFYDDGQCKLYKRNMPPSTSSQRHDNTTTHSS